MKLCTAACRARNLSVQSLMTWSSNLYSKTAGCNILLLSKPLPAHAQRYTPSLSMHQCHLQQLTFFHPAATCLPYSPHSQISTEIAPESRPAHNSHSKWEQPSPHRHWSQPCSSAMAPSCSYNRKLHQQKFQQFYTMSLRNVHLHQANHGVAEKT